MSAEPVFFFVMLVLHMALGYAAARAVYLARVEELRAALDRDRIESYGRQCYEAGQRSGAEETARKALRIGIGSN